MEASARTVSFMDRIHWIASVADILGDADLSSDFWIDRPDLEKTERQLVESIKRDERLWENLDHIEAHQFPHLDSGTVEVHAVALRPRFMDRHPGIQPFTGEVWIFQIQTFNTEDGVNINVRFMVRDFSDKEGHWQTAGRDGEMMVLSDQWIFNGYSGDPEGDSPTLTETILDATMRNLGAGLLEDAWPVMLVDPSRNPTPTWNSFMEKQVHDFTSAVETEGVEETIYRFEA